jgi:hypothetical protein
MNDYHKVDFITLVMLNRIEVTRIINDLKEKDTVLSPEIERVLNFILDNDILNIIDNLSVEELESLNIHIFKLISPESMDLMHYLVSSYRVINSSPSEKYNITDNSDVIIDP